MYRISQVAELVGLSRSTLLYYEKLRLINGSRAENGYRYYSESDVQKLRLLLQLQLGGLTLKECKACLEGKIDRDVLRQRLNALDDEITRKVQSRDVLSAMPGSVDLCLLFMLRAKIV